MRVGAIAIFTWTLLAFSGCSAGEDDTPPASRRASRPDAGGDAGVAGAFLADEGDGWVSLATGRWTIPANSERYVCVRATVTRDVAVHAFRPVNPLGTHHVAISILPHPVDPDGVFYCSTTSPTARDLIATGVGTGDLELPDGVAMRLRKGEQLEINLHLFNVRDEELAGTSGMLARIVPEDSVEHFAEMILAGPLTLDIPPGSGVEQSGQCTLTRDATIVAVGPHMHQKGVHMKIVAESSLDGSTVLFDGDYSFERQVIEPIEPVRMQANDAVHVYCTYDNDSDQTLHFGNSTLDEMCFAELIRYPESANQVSLCPR